jgi:hypothetical protein
MIPDSKAIVKMFSKKNAKWSLTIQGSHDSFEADDDLMKKIIDVHRCNFLQWKMENRVRDTVSSGVVAKLKREIDISNSRRIRFLEEIDQYYVSELKLIKHTDWENDYINSQTLGQIIDRLSVLSLRHCFAEAEIRKAPLQLRNYWTNNVAVIDEQIRYIATCYDRFLDKLKAGEGCMMRHEQIKMYGDKDANHGDERT